MIVETFPNPNKPAPVKSYYPITTTPARAPNYHPTYYDHQAKKRNITAEEFKRRDAIVRAEYDKAFYRKGDVVYPHTWEEYQKRGKCVIDGLYSSYSQFEDDDVWPKSDLPMIVNAHPVDDVKNTIVATANFFTSIEPKEGSPF